jgi:hypothetical protein
MTTVASPQRLRLWLIMANNAKEAQNRNAADSWVFTEWGAILKAAGSKETSSVEAFFAALANKNDRPQNGRLKDGAVN